MKQNQSQRGEDQDKFDDLEEGRREAGVESGHCHRASGVGPRTSAPRSQRLEAASVGAEVLGLTPAARLFIHHIALPGFWYSGVPAPQTPFSFSRLPGSMPKGAEGAALMAGKSVNKVILIGNLGKDPEVKYTPSGTPVAKLALATNERYKDKNGEWQDRTEWHNVVLWQRLAEIAGEYLKKGGKVYIEGRLQTRSWDDKQTNQKKYMTEVVASDLVLLGGRGEGGGGGDFAGSSRGAAASGGNNFDQRTPEAEPATASGPISDEDIPF